MRSKAPSILFAFVLTLLAAASLPGAQDSLGDVVAEQTQGDVAYRTGGVGSEERETLERVSSDYNLKLIFAEKGSLAFVAGVQVEIAKPSGERVFDATARGPWFLVRLPAGEWQVTATAKGAAQTQTARVPETGQTELRFYW